MFDQIEKLKSEIVILNRIIKRLQKRSMNEKAIRYQERIIKKLKVTE